MWAPKLTEALQHVPELTDVNSDQQQNGLETDLIIDRDTAARLGSNPAAIDNTLYDAFGQRQVSTIYNPLNQYHVVMEVAPQYWQSPDTLEQSVDQHRRRHGQRHAGHERGRRAPSRSAKTATSNTAAAIAADTAATRRPTRSPTAGAAAPRPAPPSAPPRDDGAALRHRAYGPGSTPLAVNHQGPFVATHDLVQPGAERRR